MRAITPVLDAAREAEQQAVATVTTVRKDVSEQLDQQVQLARGIVEIVQNAALDLYGSAFTVAEKAVNEAIKGFDHLVKKGEALHLGEQAEAAVSPPRQRRGGGQSHRRRRAPSASTRR